MHLRRRLRLAIVHKQTGYAVEQVCTRSCTSLITLFASTSPRMLVLPQDHNRELPSSIRPLLHVYG